MRLDELKWRRFDKNWDCVQFPTAHATLYRATQANPFFRDYYIQVAGQKYMRDVSPLVAQCWLYHMLGVTPEGSE